MAAEAFAPGNPRLPCPGQRDTTRLQNRKRLVILCDGTDQDSYGSKAQYPTNITRLARALTPNAWTESDKMKGCYEELEQIVYYSAGVGTFEGNTFSGSIFGTGLSEIVRAAYGFLANNYEEGDKIYIFGFSRGAYIARSLAGLVANHGLLNKRGMDNFFAVYQTFYNANVSANTGEPTDTNGPIPSGDGESSQWGLRRLPSGTVEVVGVFDTVGFHNPITAPLNRFFKAQIFHAEDRDEFPNTTLSPHVKFAFHALSLDETRTPFQTTLWFKPKQPTQDPAGNSTGPEKWTTTLKQVWFSGGHSDIGGGMQDPRLCNIALGWMISELVSHNLLAFDQDYLLENSHPSPDFSPWATIRGQNDDKYESVGFFTDLLHYLSVGAYSLVEGLKALSVWILKYISPKFSRKLSGVRTPGRYIPVKDFSKPDAIQEFDTCEEFHDSIKDRKWGRQARCGAGAVKWPCKPLLDGFKEVGNKWMIPTDKDAKEILQSRVSKIEEFLKGRIRSPGLKPSPVPPDRIEATPVMTLSVE